MDFLIISLVLMAVHVIATMMDLEIMLINVHSLGATSPYLQTKAAQMLMQMAMLTVPMTYLMILHNG